MLRKLIHFKPVRFSSAQHGLFALKRSFHHSTPRLRHNPEHDNESIKIAVYNAIKEAKLHVQKIEAEEKAKLASGYDSKKSSHDEHQSLPEKNATTHVKRPGM